MDLNEDHPEGHPDGRIIGDEWLRVVEGFLEPDRLTDIIVQNQNLHQHHAKNARIAQSVGNMEVGLMNQMVASIHLTAYHNAILQIGVVKRLECICDILDKALDNGGEEWNGQHEPPGDPENPYGPPDLPDSDKTPPEMPEEPESSD
ncbi:hypothetical protein KAR91_50260 [Candidatus Pacearchaeota archaeon]|nr:hypothetical protein [Candidatus Pacearchaeota archaeon]